MVKFRERYALLCERRRNKVFQIVSDNPQVVTIDWAELYRGKDIAINKQIGGSRKDKSLIPSMVSADHLITTRWFLTAAGILSPAGAYLTSDEVGHIYTPFYHGESDRLLFVDKQEAKNWARFYLRAFSGSGLRIIGDSEVLLVEF
ncbi:MAG: hypothetical protein WCW56_03345 [Candidatus Paceibacterota bacterium]|jgi:hypothetical protein